MSSIYDNWERLVAATLNREKLRELARLSSIETNSSISSVFNTSPNNSHFLHVLDCVPDSLMDRVIKAAENTIIFKRECLEIKSKAENLAGMLRQAASASNDLYERPTLRIVSDTEFILEKALELVRKCSSNSIPADAFQNMSSLLENSIEDVSWLISISNPQADVELRSPPITINEPMLCHVWEQITTLYMGSMADRSDAAASLASLARGSDQYGKLIVEEGGVGPLLQLVEEGNLEGKENAIRAIEWLARNPVNAQHMIDAGVPIPLGTTYELQNSRERIENEIVEATAREFRNSREQIVNEIVEALTDDEGIRMVRICGIGGVGKTTVRQILNRVKEENIFQDILSSVKIIKSFISRVSHGILSSASNLIKRQYNVRSSEPVPSHILHSSIRFPWYFYVSFCCLLLLFFIQLFRLIRAISYSVPHSSENPPKVSVLDVVSLVGISLELIMMVLMMKSLHSVLDYFSRAFQIFEDIKDYLSFRRSREAAGWLPLV